MLEMRCGPSWKIIYKTILLICLMMLSVLSKAHGVDDDLQSYYRALGGSTNITHPHAYHSQQAGNYTGGSLFVRNRVESVQLISFDEPTLRAGCGGIDLYLGGLSFIKADKLVQAFKAVLANTKGYAFNLALSSEMPQVKAVLDHIHGLANRMNQANINSCEQAEALVGGLWSKTSLSQRNVCEQAAVQGQSADWTEARSACGADGQADVILAREKANKKSSLRKMILRGNLVWESLNDNALYRDEYELKELLMTLSGTIIVSSSGGKYKHLSLPPLLNEDNFLKSMLEGGKASVYKCHKTDKDCLSPHVGNITIKAASGLSEQVRTLLGSITQKIYHDEPLNDKEQALLEKTTLPVYKILSVEAAYYKDKDILAIERYSDAIAIDLLFGYLNNALDIVSQNVDLSKYPEAMVNEFKDGIRRAHRMLSRQHDLVIKRMASKNRIVREVMNHERALGSKLSTGLQDSLQWQSGGVR